MNATIEPGLIFAAVLLVVTLAPVLVMIAMAIHWSRQAKPPSVQQGNALYADRLIEIWPDYIVLFNYYFPTANSAKYVPMDTIEALWTKPCTLGTGKWRIYGTSNFKTWFPMDTERPNRDRVFFVDLNTQSTRIGFTVERPDEVEELLKEKGLLKTGDA